MPDDPYDAVALKLAQDTAAPMVGSEEYMPAVVAAYRFAVDHAAINGGEYPEVDTVEDYLAAVGLIR